MNLQHVPLLQTQRDLHDVPRGRDRFEQYLRTILTPDGTDVELLPLVLMNPMARDRVTALLEALLAAGADAAGTAATADAAGALAAEPGDFKVTLVVADDLIGGGANWWAYEFDLRFGLAPHTKRFWGLIGVLGSSEPPSAAAAREAVLTAAHRVASVRRHGPARTLRARMAQEGRVLAAAGCGGPTLDPDDLAYSREVIAPHLGATDMRTAVERLFGDAAGRTLGFTPRGPSPRAGVALALHDARAASSPSCGSPQTA